VRLEAAELLNGEGRVDTEDGQLSVEVNGPQDGPVIVLLPRD
jgi:hypothetical protein